MSRKKVGGVCLIIHCNTSNQNCTEFLNLYCLFFSIHFSESKKESKPYDSAFIYILYLHLRHTHEMHLNLKYLQSLKTKNKLKQNITRSDLLPCPKFS